MIYIKQFGVDYMGQRGRKKGSNGAESKALLLRIATEVFAQNGYHATKVNQIVRKANLTQPTFYLYFKSKEAIFQELVDSFQSNLNEMIKEYQLDSSIQQNSINERIEEGLSRIFQFFADNPDLTRIGFYVTDNAENVKRQLTAKVKEYIISENLVDYFQTEVDLDIFTESLVGTIERLTFTQLFQGLKKPEELAHDVVSLLLNGI